MTHHIHEYSNGVYYATMYSPLGRVPVFMNMVKLADNAKNVQNAYLR